MTAWATDAELEETRDNPRRVSGPHWSMQWPHGRPAVPSTPGPEARRVGIRALVDVGWSAYSSTIVDDQERPVGGVIVAIDHVPVTDADGDQTGEVERVFVTVTPYRGGVKVHRLRESDIGPEGLEGPVTNTMLWASVGLTRSFLDAVVHARGDRLKPLTPRACEHLGWAVRLTQIVMGGRG